MRMERKNSLRDSAVGSPDCNLKNSKHSGSLWIDYLEICLLFFDGEFSHAVKKWGKEMKYIHPSDDQYSMVTDVMSYFKEPPFLTRVDLVRRENGTLILGELEITDRSVYLTEELAKNLAMKIIEKCKP